MNSPVVSDPTQFEEVVEEVNQRNRRKRNLIIFGVDEQNQQEPPQVRLEREKTFIKNMIQAVDSEVELPDLRPVRLGLFTTGKNRPIKIVLSSEDHVHRLIRKSKVLKTHKDYKKKKLSISFDRTPRQLEFYRNLKIELENRKQAGEANLHIKYVKGIPRIVLN
nr:unnamed protein product [Callosobruchus analis]